MERVYYDLVVAQRRTCNPDNKNLVLVPPKYLDAVLALLIQDGRDADGNKIA